MARYPLQKVALGDSRRSDNGSPCLQRRFEQRGAGPESSGGIVSVPVGNAYELQRYDGRKHGSLMGNTVWRGVLGCSESRGWAILRLHMFFHVIGRNDDHNGCEMFE